MQNLRLRIRQSMWRKLMKRLKKHGEGKRETGAFLLGNGNEVNTFICYHDLDPHVSDTGIIVFNGDGYIGLWEYCSKHRLKVLADVHTHPGGWTGQSTADMDNPMVAQPGHMALIVPNLATKRNQKLNGVGVHEFLGLKEWKHYEEQDRVVELTKN